MGRRIQGKSRWRPQIPEGGASEGGRGGAGALVAPPDQRVPVHGAGRQRLRLLSSLFPLMSVSFSPRGGSGCVGCFGPKIQVNSFISVREGSAAKGRRVGGLTRRRCTSPAPNTVALSSRTLRASVLVMSHLKYVRRLKGGLCFSSDFFFFFLKTFISSFVCACVSTKRIRALPFQDCVGISHVAVLLVQKNRGRVKNARKERRL